MINRTVKAACMTLGLSFLSLALAQGQPTVGGTLVVGMESEADVLDPHATGGWVTARVTYQIFEGLVMEDLKDPKAQTPKLLPGLATSWTMSKDAKSYTFKLRKGVKFHDGTSFDASAVKFNIERMSNKNFKYFYPRASSYTGQIWVNLKSVNIIDPYTVKIDFTKPFPEFLRISNQSWGQPLMISPTAVKKYGNEGIALHPIGTGPFKFFERKPNDRLVIVRNETYWGKKPYLDKIIFRPITDTATRINALNTKEVDMILAPTPDSLEMLEKSGNKVVYNNGPHIWYLFLNMNNKYTKDPKVRQAIQMAINREGMAKQLLKGSVSPAYGMLPPGSPAYDKNFKMYSYNPEKAKQLLKEAGYPNGFETIVQTSVSGSGQIMPTDMMVWINKDLAKVGIKTKLETYEWVTYLNMMGKGMKPEVASFQMSWGQTADYWLSMVTHSRFKAPQGSNVGRYGNTKVDALLDRATAEPSEAKRINLYRQAHTLIMKDASYVPIVNDRAPIVVAPNVRGFVNPAEEWFTLSNVWLAK